MVLSTEWSQVEVIDLINDGNGLGFMLVGGKSTGVVIKALIPGGLAERDGRLQCGDHVLQIGDVNLRGFSSEQVATVLRQCSHQVRLVVARSIEPSSQEYQALATHAPIIPTKLLTDPEELDRTLLQTAAFTSGFLQLPDENQTTAIIIPTVQTHIEVVAVNNAINVESHGLTLPIVSPLAPALIQSVGQVELIATVTSPDESLNDYLDLPETETYEVELHKNVYGLGITVAGYVCEEEDLSGIFVKSIIEGSAAEMSGQIQINDRIVAVDGKSLSGVTNHQAVELLRNTDIIVRLTLERFLRGRKYEHLQVALTDGIQKNGNSQNSLPPSPSVTTLSLCPGKLDGDSIITEGAECEYKGIDPEIVSCTTIDSNIFGTKENGDMNGKHGCNDIEYASRNTTPTPTTSNCIINSLSPKDPILNEWTEKVKNAQIVVCEVNKLAGLGISLEGTVDVEGGVELRPHHYIRSILAEGPVGKDGSLMPGDELLQVNEHQLQGLKHTDVVKILRDLPSRVKVVCARGAIGPHVIDTSNDPEAFETRSLLPGGLQCLQGMLTKAQSESSLYTSSTATLTDQQRSKSVEQVSGLALWSTEVVYVNVEKTERGFGFSILDYQDPLDTDGTVIVVRGLIPGGAAEGTSLIFPGDRLVSVNEHSLQGATLDEAVIILKGIPVGTARIGLCRPLSTSDCSSPAETPT